MYTQVTEGEKSPIFQNDDERELRILIISIGKPLFGVSRHWTKTCMAHGSKYSVLVSPAVWHGHWPGLGVFAARTGEGYSSTVALRGGPTQLIPLFIFIATLHIYQTSWFTYY